MKLRENAAVMASMGTEDPLVWVKLAFFSDLVFQKFCKKLTTIISESLTPGEVMDTARDTLGGWMEGELERVLFSLEFGVIPQLPLPESLKPRKKRRADEETEPAAKKGRRKEKVEKEGVDEPDWWKRNPSPEQNWHLPSGTSCRSVFNPNDEAKADWSRNWPMVGHHKHGREAHLCQRYTVDHFCPLGGNCRSAHLPTGKLGPEDLKLVNEKVKLGREKMGI